MKAGPPDEKVGWSRVEELYHEALSKPREQRAQFLASACRGNEGLLLEVASLLEYAEKEGARLEVRALDVAARMLAKGEASLSAGPPASSQDYLTLPDSGNGKEIFRPGDVPARGLSKKGLAGSARYGFIFLPRSLPLIASCGLIFMPGGPRHPALRHGWMAPGRSSGH